MTQEERQELVNQLTAIGLILFEMIEGLEDDYPYVTAHLRAAADWLIELIKEVVIDQFNENAQILKTPRLVVDASFNPAAPLEQIHLLKEYLSKVEQSFDASQALAVGNAANAIHIAGIEMVQALRPQHKETGEERYPWEYLEESLGSKSQQSDPTPET